MKTLNKKQLIAVTGAGTITPPPVKQATSQQDIYELATRGTVTPPPAP
ncbi:hypothetical protein [Pseudoalteromonas luteoviolacea]|nr:hypothetical protein [Pseudoalteromonas luteoviolacea]